MRCFFWHYLKKKNRINGTSRLWSADWLASLTKQTNKQKQTSQRFVLVSNLYFLYCARSRWKGWDFLSIRSSFLFMVGKIKKRKEKKKRKEPKVKLNYGLHQAALLITRRWKRYFKKQSPIAFQFPFFFFHSMCFVYYWTVKNICGQWTHPSLKL